MIDIFYFMISVSDCAIGNRLQVYDAFLIIKSLLTEKHKQLSLYNVHVLHAQFILALLFN